MDFEKVALMLSNAGHKKRIFYSEYEIKEEMLNQEDDYYSVKKNQSKWQLIHVHNERKNEPDIEIIKEFDDKDSAIKTFALNRLNYLYSENEIVQAKEITNWYEKIDSLEILDIKSALNQMNISSSYLSIESKKCHSMYIFKEGESWRSGYIDSSGNLECKSRLDSLSFSISVAFTRILLLYLLDNMCKREFQMANATSYFSTDDIAYYLKGY